MSYGQLLVLQMSYGNLLPLASIEAVRPVFMIVMGLFLMVIAWRLSKNTGTWTSRMIIAGALLLGFGYGVMMPLYEAGIIENLSSKGQYRDGAATALAWHCVKITVMNSGWLFLGIGVAMHARVFTPLATRKKAISPSLPTHESIA